MLSPDNHLGIFAALMGLAALAFWLQTTRLGALLTGTVLVILMAIVAANVGLIPHQAPTYDFVFTYLVPVLIPLFLLQGDARSASIGPHLSIHWRMLGRYPLKVLTTRGH